MMKNQLLHLDELAEKSGTPVQTILEWIEDGIFNS